MAFAILVRRNVLTVRHVKLRSNLRSNHRFVTRALFNTTRNGNHFRVERQAVHIAASPQLFGIVLSFSTLVLLTVAFILVIKTAYLSIQLFN